MAEYFDVSLHDLVHYGEQQEALPLPPKGKHLFGTVTVGIRGQIVLPKRAREIFHIQAGDSIVVLGDEAQGLALIKADEMIEFIEKAMREANEEM